MKVIYDRETDTLTMILAEAPVAESDELRDGVVIDYDRAGHIVSLEVMNASEHVAEPASIAFELKEPAAR
jgi:uncharacterized protein YuzE